MESAFKSAPDISVMEEEAQESSVAGFSHQVGLRSTGLALAGGASSYHSPHEEGGEESEVGDAKSGPVVTLGARLPVEGSLRAKVEEAGGSLSPLVLMPIPEALGVSPTTRLLSKPIIAESPGESSEKVSYGSSDGGVDWGDLTVSSPGKASAYTHFSRQGKCYHLKLLPHFSFVFANNLPRIGSLAREETPPPDQSVAIIPSPGWQTAATYLIATPPPVMSAPLVIPLRPTHETSSPSQIPAEAFTALPSSPSTLNVLIPSVASSLASSVAVTPVVMTLVATSSSPTTSLSPMDVPNLLGTFVGHLEQTMRMTVEVVSAGQGNFESFRLLLLNCFHSNEFLGDAQCTKRCSEGISRLERELNALHDLNCIDLKARIESTFADVRTEAMHHFEILQRSLGEKEIQVASTKTQCDQWQSELTSMTSIMQATRASVATVEETIAQLQMELAQQKAKLSREEADVKDLTRMSVEASNDYCQEIQDLQEMKREATTVAPDEEELRREAAAMVWATHEKDVAEIKSQLASIMLRGPSA